MHVVVERREEDGEINQQIWLHKRQEEMKEERCNDVKEKNKNKKHFTKKQQDNNNTFTITKPQETNFITYYHLQIAKNKTHTASKKYMKKKYRKRCHTYIHGQ